MNNPKSQTQQLSSSTLQRRALPEIEDLAEVLTALERPLRALAGSGVRLEVECAPCAGRLALNSEDLLRILANLVVNAVDAIAVVPPELRRRPFINIIVHRDRAWSFIPHYSNEIMATVVLSVRDNGSGIAGNHLPHILEAGHSTRRGSVWRPEGDSRGTGLSIVRQLVEAAGGAVRAVSSRGLGARFDIELPLVSAAPKARIDFVNPGCQSHSKNLQQSSAQTEKEA